jgi:peptidyl-prolyl cis-trans isomerase A (cyclophilin A)
MHPRLLASLGTAALASVVTFASITGSAACSSSASSVPVTEAGAQPVAEAGAAKDAAPPVVTDPGPDPLPGCTKDPGAATVQVDPNAASDPTGGAEKFTLAQALEGLPATGGKLTVGINTEKATIRCELFEATAPISVANFVGLARGTRPYRDENGKWKVGHFYDGLTWHRVIPDFVIQGGDPDGTGTGGPGYDLVNENHVDEPLGTLAMAASKTPSGSQFYVVVGKGPPPDYNVFGTCTTESAIAIANVERDRTNAPTVPVHMLKVAIGRCP